MGFRCGGATAMIEAGRTERVALPPSRSGRPGASDGANGSLLETWRPGGTGNALARGLAAIAVGAGVALLAWTVQWSWGIGILLSLPVLWAACGSRAEAGCLYLGYLLAGTHDLPSIIARFFPALPAGAPIGLWLATAIVLAVPWIVLWRRRMRPLRAASGCAAAVLLVTVPPLGFVGWLSPIALAGQLFPGFGFAGAALTWMMLAALAGASRLSVARAAAAVSVLLAGVGMIALLANLVYVQPSAPVGWRSLDTHVGRYPPAEDLVGRLAWHQALTDAVNEKLADRTLRVLVLPEEILGQQDPMVAAAWSSIGAQARARGVTVLAGVDLPRPGGGYLDALWELTAGSRVVAAARVPMPLGQWRPWRVDSSPMNLSLGHSEVVGARPVGVSFCYEDFLFWVQAFTMLGQRPDVLISVANNWFDAGADAQRIQALHIQMWARLWGLPLIRATNWGENPR